MLIATVDKFAMMAWKGAVRTLFGKVSCECPRHGLLWPDADCKGQHTKKKSLPATVVQAVKKHSAAGFDYSRRISLDQWTAWHDGRAV